MHRCSIKGILKSKEDKQQCLLSISKKKTGSNVRMGSCARAFVLCEAVLAQTPTSRFPGSSGFSVSECLCGSTCACACYVCVRAEPMIAQHVEWCGIYLWLRNLLYNKSTRHNFFLFYPISLFILFIRGQVQRSHVVSLTHMLSIQVFQWPVVCCSVLQETHSDTSMYLQARDCKRHETAHPWNLAHTHSNIFISM